MRYAFISDIHSNLEALSAVLKQIDFCNIDETVCLGDIVGYNANPNECIEIINGRNIKCVMGNHDARAAGLEEPDDFTYLAKEAILWTRGQLTSQSLAFLKNLPRRLSFSHDKLLAVHGSLQNTDEYIFSLQDVAANFALMDQETDANTCFFGHTHIRITYKEMKKSIYPCYENIITIEEAMRYLINPGSVGQPRDGDSKASFLIYDTSDRKVEFFRISYDIDKACRKIIVAGLPIELAERLTSGW